MQDENNKDKVETVEKIDEQEPATVKPNQGVSVDDSSSKNATIEKSQELQQDIQTPAGKSSQELSEENDANQSTDINTSNELGDSNQKDNPKENNEEELKVADESVKPQEPADAEVEDEQDLYERKHIEAIIKRRESARKILLEKNPRNAKPKSESYYTNSPKESIILGYVDNFVRQYGQLFPGRKELLMCPFNEFDIKKFICTTIRPSQLPFKELYDYKSCAKFVADYLSYVPLDPPYETPTKVPSPTYTLKFQEGNCFDYAILLVSLLRGSGYDAYVVSGYASKDITICDESKKDISELSLLAEGLGFYSDYTRGSSDGKGKFWMIGEELGNVLEDDEEGLYNENHLWKANAPAEPEETRKQSATDEANDQQADVSAIPVGAVNGKVDVAEKEINNLTERLNFSNQTRRPNKYKVRPPKTLASQFLLKQEQKRVSLEKQLLKEKEVELKNEKLKAEVEDDDELRGLRVHAWVLVLPGKREVAEAFFIEPSTANIYSTDHTNYLGVESVFSNANYWVNMQICYEGLSGISFDLGDNTKWEFVLIDNSQPGVSGVNINNVLEDDDDDETHASSPLTPNGTSVTVKKPEILELPKSWVDKISMSVEEYTTRCPCGYKTVLYKNAKCEMFAEYHREDGMVARITFFADPEKNYFGEIIEIFCNRKDKLWKRIRNPYEEKVHELFEPGKSLGLREHVIIDDKTKEMYFFSNSRHDGLMKRIIEDEKIIELFVNREDRLTYRSIRFDSCYLDSDLKGVVKFTEKYKRNPNVPASEDPDKITYLLKEDKIKVIYHIEHDRIISSFQEFKKPSQDPKGTAMELVNGFEVDPYKKPLKKQQLYAKLHKLMVAEQACLQAYKNNEREMKELLHARENEEKEIQLLVSVYDSIRNSNKLPTVDEKEAQNIKVEESRAADLDYLSPFLVNYPPFEKLTKEDANAIRDACLKSMKERLLEKAAIIQGRLDEVSNEYQKRQLAYSRNADSMSVEETEEYVKFCNNALFKIHILEKRLAKHKESAPIRYMQLDTKLHADKRLII